MNCEGGKAIFDGQLLSQTLIHNHDTVVIKDRKVKVDKTQEKERYTVLDSKQELQCSRLTSSRYFADKKKNWDVVMVRKHLS